ncbi:hypothetical protein QOT17_016665 [Balamuthia mandrillaris]
MGNKSPRRQQQQKQQLPQRGACERGMSTVETVQPSLDSTSYSEQLYAKLLILLAHKKGQELVFDTPGSEQAYIESDQFCLFHLLPKELVVMILRLLDPILAFDESTIIPKDRDDEITISKDRQTVQLLKKNSNFVSLFLTRPRRRGEALDIYFRFDATLDGNCGIGFNPSNHFDPALNSALCIGWETGKTSGWCMMTYMNYGKKRAQQADSGYIENWPCLKAGEVVGMHLSASNELRYSRNGKGCGLAFRVDDCEKLWPGICLGTGNQTITLLHSYHP